jgi:uncharacterized protein YcnI
MKKTMLFALMLAAVFPAAAAGHVTANPSEAPANGFAMVSFRVPHGCDDSATTSLTVRIPAGVSSVTPEAVPGWEVTTEEGPLPEPIESEGETVTEGVTEVTWTGGPLSAHQFTDFGLSMRMPDRPGETIYFPAVQRCEQGSTGWVQIPVEGQPEPDTPAPGVTLVGSGGGDDASSSDDEGSAAPVVAAEEEDDEGLDTLAVVLGAAGLAAGLLALGLTLFRKPRSS